MFVKNLLFVFVLLSTVVDKNFISNKIDLRKNKNFTSLSVKKFILELRGGGKKRKKKNFTKPKKNKHIKKKITLRYLNYYSVTEGKAQKIKKTSPESPGCFMAEHIDRLTCGKSGLTFTRS
jgi:small subunit ribosomal protein S27Ae